MTPKRKTLQGWQASPHLHVRPDVLPSCWDDCCCCSCSSGWGRLRHGCDSDIQAVAAAHLGCQVAVVRQPRRRHVLGAASLSAQAHGPRERLLRVRMWGFALGPWWRDADVVWQPCRIHGMTIMCEPRSIPVYRRAARIAELFRPMTTDADSGSSSGHAAEQSIHQVDRHTILKAHKWCWDKTAREGPLTALVPA